MRACSMSGAGPSSIQDVSWLSIDTNRESSWTAKCNSLRFRYLAMQNIGSMKNLAQLRKKNGAIQQDLGRVVCHHIDKPRVNTRGSKCCSKGVVAVSGVHSANRTGSRSFADPRGGGKRRLPDTARI